MLQWFSSQRTAFDNKFDDNIYFKLKYKPSFNELLPANQQFFHDNTPLINQLKGVSRILQVFFCQSACI